MADPQLDCHWYLYMIALAVASIALIVYAIRS